MNYSFVFISTLTFFLLGLNYSSAQETKQVKVGQVKIEIPSGYDVVKKLGEGRLGKVFLVRNSENNNLEVLKIPKAQKLSKKRAIRALEMEKVARLPMWEKYKLGDGSSRWVDDQNHELGLIKKFVEGPTLDELFNKDSFWKKGDPVRLDLTKKLVDLIRKGVFIGDIKGENLVADVNDRSKVKIIDSSYILEELGPEGAALEYEADWIKRGRMFTGVKDEYKGKLKKLLKKILQKGREKPIIMMLEQGLEEIEQLSSYLKSQVCVENERVLLANEIEDDRIWVNQGLVNYRNKINPAALYPFPCVDQKIRDEYARKNPDSYKLDYAGKVYVPPSDEMWEFYQQRILDRFVFDNKNPYVKSLVVFGTKTDGYTDFPKKYGTMSRKLVQYPESEKDKFESNMRALNPKRGNKKRIIDIHTEERMDEINQESAYRMEFSPYVMMVNRFLKDKQSFFRAYRSGAKGEFKTKEGHFDLYPSSMKDELNANTVLPARPDHVTDHELYTMFTSEHCSKILSNSVFADDKTKFEKRDRRRWYNSLQIGRDKTDKSMQKEQLREDIQQDSFSERGYLDDSVDANLDE